MSVFKRIVILCDMCTGGPCCDAPTVGDARRDFHAFGGVTRNGHDLCSDCKDKPYCGECAAELRPSAGGGK